MTAITLVGWIGSSLVVLSLVQKDIHRLRQVDLASAVVLGVFNVTIGLPSMIALNIVLAAVNGYHLATDRPGADHTAGTTGWTRQPGRDRALEIQRGITGRRQPRPAWELAA